MGADEEGLCSSVPSVTKCVEVLWFRKTMKAAWTSVPQASITLSARISFKDLWEKATRRLSDRGERIVGTKSRKRQLLPL